MNTNKRIIILCGLTLLISHVVAASKQLMPTNQKTAFTASWFNFEPFTYVDFNISMGNPRHLKQWWSPHDKEWLAAWKKHYDKYNPSRVSAQSETIIPKIIHQIWIGGPVPERYKVWIESWKKFHPQWQYKLWTDEDVKHLTLFNRELYDKLTNYGPKADILRFEILYQFGGLYVDTDFECFKAHDVFHHRYSFYAGIEDGGAIAIGPALMASTAGHPLMEQLVKNIKLEVKDQNQIRAVIAGTSSGYLTRAFGASFDSNDPTVIVFPHSYFFPLACNDRRASLAQRTALVRPETFGMHHWGLSWIKKG